jgi:hypothetical protein
MKFVNFLFVVVSTVTFLLFARPPSASAKTCEDLLANNRYKCTYKVEGLGDFPYSTCFQVTTPGVSSDFTLQVFPTITLRCSCLAQGNLKNPKYDQSKEFLCVSSNGHSATGKATSQKLKDGHLLIYGAGGIYIYECTLDPQCNY